MSLIQAVPRLTIEGYHETPSHQILASESTIKVVGDVGPTDLGDPLQTMTFGYVVSADGVSNWNRISTTTWRGGLINKQGVLSQPTDGPTIITPYRGQFLRIFVDVPIGQPISVGALVEIL